MELRLDTDEYLKADKSNYHKLAPKIDALGFTQVKLILEKSTFGKDYHLFCTINFFCLKWLNF